MIRLNHSFALFGLLVPLSLALWQRWLRRHGQRHVGFPARLLFGRGLPAPAWETKLLAGLEWVKLGALALLALAMAQPQRINVLRVEEQRGVDIMLTLDISGSMASMDFQTKNRLEVAKEVIADFISRRSSDRLGLVIFAATAYTRCPLTVDRDVLREFLQEVQIGDIEDGTAIGLALATAVKRISGSGAKSKLIILLTDGVNNRGEIDPRDAARMARDFGVKVYAIGVGTRGQAPYPVPDALGRPQYMMVDVEIDEPLLQEIARTTGGLYLRATDTASLQSIFTDIDRWEKTRHTTRTVSERFELAPFLIAAGLFLLLLVEVSRRTWLRVLP